MLVLTRRADAGNQSVIQSFEGDTGQAPTLSRFLQYYEMKPDDL